MGTKLKIYTDLSLLEYGNPIPLIYPFSGAPPFENNPDYIGHGRFDDYICHARRFMEMSTPEQADYFVLPVGFPSPYQTGNIPERIRNFCQQARNLDKKILIVPTSDDGSIDAYVPDAIVLDTNLFRHFRKKNHILLPLFFEDFIKQYYNDQLVVREKKDCPRVGFCGYTPPLGLPFGKEKAIGMAKMWACRLGIMKYFPHKISHAYRAILLKSLEQDPHIKATFVYKKNFGFGITGLNTGKQTESNEVFRKGYVDNIIQTDYTVCTRGIRNCSVRFYETLCCGRIPVFLDTDSVLPFENLIDWKKYCVWIEEKDIPRAGKMIQDYHQRLSPEAFKERQYTLRRIWEEYLSPEGFFSHLEEAIKAADI